MCVDKALGFKETERSEGGPAHPVLTPPIHVDMLEPIIPVPQPPCHPAAQGRVSSSCPALPPAPQKALDQPLSSPGLSFPLRTLSHPRPSPLAAPCTDAPLLSGQLRPLRGESDQEGGPPPGLSQDGPPPSLDPFPWARGGLWGHGASLANVQGGRCAQERGFP